MGIEHPRNLNLLPAEKFGYSFDLGVIIRNRENLFKRRHHFYIFAKFDIMKATRKSG